MHLLHVEDNPIDADLTRRLLQRSTPDLELTLAQSLREARHILRKDPSRFDLVLIDLRLPDGSGLELLQFISAAKSFCVGNHLDRKSFHQINLFHWPRKGLPPQRLKLELTESMIMDRGPQAVTLLQNLKNLGVALSIDDFGTGYSSLAYLKRFPLDELKIDQSFVRDISIDQNDREIAAIIITMAKTFNLEVVAEGVETQAQLDFLIQQNCPSCQGYLFSRPLTASAFAEFAKKNYR